MRAMNRKNNKNLTQWLAYVHGVRKWYYEMLNNRCSALNQWLLKSIQNFYWRMEGQLKYNLFEFKMEVQECMKIILSLQAQQGLGLY